MASRRNRRKQTVPTKQRPVTRSTMRSTLNDVNEIHSNKSDGNLKTSISMEKDVELISETFTDNFTLSETEQIIDENNYSDITEPSLPNDVSNNNISNHSEDFDLYCYASCQLGRKYDRSMIQCCTCMVWHHSECTSVSSETTGIWNCDKCRSIPQAIDHLTNQSNEMHSLLSSMVEKQNDLL